MKFSARHPGGLAAHLVGQIRARTNGPASDYKELYRTDLGVWAQRDGVQGLKEVRDQREVQLLARAVTLLNQQKVAEAADLLCMRVREVTHAKKQGGTWEKAELLSLMPCAQASSAPMPDGCLSL